MSKLKQVKLACQDCNATGLHTGQFTGKGTATICATCKGEGYITAEYEPFKKRRKLRGVKKIFQSAFGCPIFVDGVEQYELENGDIIEVNFNDYDCSYNNWVNGDKSPILLKELACPLIYSSKDLEVVKQMGCNEHAILGTPVGAWDCYKTKHVCWEKYKDK